MNDIHAAIMKQAIQEASQGIGRTYPNPPVGCVIVHNGQIVARGYHRQAGQPHAEIMAFRVFDTLGIDASACEIYVTLEPCCIHGRTPPCTEAVLKRGFKRAFVGSRDPNPKVDGGGVGRLRQQGVEVTEGVLVEQTNALIAPFAKRILTGLPLVSLKYAMTLDGKIATHTGHSQWITNAKSREHVHQLRDQHDAILVGTGTLLQDDPRLTCRLPEGRSPARFVLDAHGKVGAQFKVYEQEVGTPSVAVHVVTKIGQEHPAMSLPGVHVHELEVDAEGRFSMDALLRLVAQQGYTSLLVEGGAHIHGALLDDGLADQVYAYVAPVMFGGQAAPGPIKGQGVAEASQGVRLEQVTTTSLDGDLLVHGKVDRAQRAYPIEQF